MPATATRSTVRFTETELAGIARARTEQPNAGQRTLASFIYKNYSIFGINSGRSQVSIAHAIRRFDRKAKEAAAAKVN